MQKYHRQYKCLHKIVHYYSGKTENQVSLVKEGRHIKNNSGVYKFVAQAKLGKLNIKRVYSYHKIDKKELHNHDKINISRRKTDI